MNNNYQLFVLLQGAAVTIIAMATLYMAAVLQGGAL